MTYLLRIDPDGTIIEIDDPDLLGVSRAAFDGSTQVVACAAPWLPGHVGVVHDWGRTEGMPLNKKAWACYGRSPIFGPMFLAYDQDEAGGRPELHPEIAEILQSDLAEIVPPNVIDNMQRIAEAEGVDW